MNSGSHIAAGLDSVAVVDLASYPDLFGHLSPSWLIDEVEQEAMSTHVEEARASVQGTGEFS